MAVSSANIESSTFFEKQRVLSNDYRNRKDKGGAQERRRIEIDIDVPSFVTDEEILQYVIESLTVWDRYTHYSQYLFREFNFCEPRVVPIKKRRTS